MTYPLLERAPKDHNSYEFLQFLRENNEVIEENVHFLIIVNCKYDKPERRWFTAFAKSLYPDVCFFLEKYRDWEWLKKPAHENSVKRFHIHLIEPVQ